jgi:hypothetical protein
MLFYKLVCVVYPPVMLDVPVKFVSVDGDHNLNEDLQMCLISFTVRLLSI